MWAERWIVYNNADPFNPVITAPMTTWETELEAKNWVAVAFDDGNYLQPNPVIFPIQVWIEE